MNSLILLFCVRCYKISCMCHKFDDYGIKNQLNIKGTKKKDFKSLLKWSYLYYCGAIEYIVLDKKSWNE